MLCRSEAVSCHIYAMNHHIRDIHGLPFMSSFQGLSYTLCFSLFSHSFTHKRIILSASCRSFVYISLNLGEEIYFGFKESRKNWGTLLESNEFFLLLKNLIASEEFTSYSSYYCYFTFLIKNISVLLPPSPSHTPYN